MFRNLGRKSGMPDPADALPGRAEPLPPAERHFVNDQPLKGPYPAGSEIAEFAQGCFGHGTVQGAAEAPASAESPDFRVAPRYLRHD